MNKKVNTIAKIGRIITTIVAVFMILAAIATAVGIGITASMPKEALQVEISGTADVTAKGEVLESIANAIIDSSEGGKGEIKLGDSDVAIGDVEDSVPDDVTAKKTDKGITLSADGYKMNLTVKSVLVALIFTFINTVCAVVVLFMIRALFKSIEKSETPFSDDVIKRMKNFGFSLIPLAIINGTSENAWDSLTTMGANIHFGVDFKIVFGILIVFMLAMIFSYGAQLQKQSDETL